MLSSMQVVSPSSMMMGSASSMDAAASGWIALLQEEDLSLRTAAMQKLLDSVDRLWHQIAERLPDLEAAAEDDALPQQLRQTAAALASRVFFHLEEPQQALRLALLAGPQHFDPNDSAVTAGKSQSPYVQKLVQAALDAYITNRRKLIEGIDDAADSAALRDETAEGLSMESLQTMVNSLLDSACRAHNYEHALAITLEAQEPTQFQTILQSAVQRDPNILQYALHLTTSTVTSKAFRLQALQVLAEHLHQLFVVKKDVAAYDLIRVYQLLNQPQQVGAVLKELFNSTGETEQYNTVLALQLCFDLMDTGNQAFCQAVASQLTAEQPHEEQALKILTGGFVSELHLSLLHKHCKADRLIMETLKKTLEERSSGGRSSILHNAAVMTHSYLYAGTTNDSFLRQYLDWMKKASNWAKFSATASLGVIHAGHVTEAMHLLQPYLPADPNDGEVSATGGYSEGGSLYALGLIHAGTGTSAAKRAETTEFIRQHLRASHANEVISHGACLGVGLTAMGSADLNIVRELREVLDTDSAVAGEAAGIAIGLILVGTGAGSGGTTNANVQNKEELEEVVAELKNYARETEHEKIIRAIVMALAFMQTGQEEGADALIEELRSDRDPILRYGAAYATALAYVGTGSNKAIRILLHTAVSDVSDDVRMAAVLGLAFVLFKTPERVPQLVRLLLESFNPHVRYASCMAIGIAMAGTGNSEAIALIEPMLDDMTDYVRQGALMGTALIFMQQSDTCKRIRSFRERLSTIVAEKHQSTLTKMGAILSTGILDAAGRNAVLNLESTTAGFTKLSSAVGLALWLQHWHWFPMMHCFSLTLTPTFMIGLNQDFQYPKKFELVCQAKPSQFAYPKKLEAKKEEKKKRVETVTLSTTAKEKARLARKRAKLGQEESMEVVSAEPLEKSAIEGGADAGAADAASSDAATEDQPKVPKKKVREPTSFKISNPSRVTKTQAALCFLDPDQVKYRPIRPNKLSGILMLINSKVMSSVDGSNVAEMDDDDDDDLGKIQSPMDEPEGELPPPEPFVWTVPTSK